MKKLLLPALALFATGSFAQTYYSEDFADISDWVLTDADGDGQQWASSSASSGSEPAGLDAPFALSRSWTSGTGALTPDNYMTSGPVTITGGAANAYLQWEAGALQGAPFHAEEYTVYIGTTPGATTGTMVFTETLAAGETLYNHSVNMSAYIGSTVYLIFRHNGSTDMNGLIIDNVVVKTLPANEIEMTALDIPSTVTTGSVTIKGTVKNNGANTITSFDVDWNDGTSHNQTFTGVSIAPGASYNWTHGTQLSATGGTTYNLNVCADLAGDADASNDCLAATVSAVTSIPTKYTVGWEKTGTWCGWCPRGAVALENMESTSQFIGIAAHNGDPMTVSYIDAAIGTYVPGGYPGAGVDNVEVGDPTDFSSMHATRVTEIAPASISVAAVQSGSNMEITVTADFVGALSGDYRLACVIVENDVTGTTSGYNQANYYSGGGAGALSGAGHDWAAAPNPVPAADMEYDHVARAMGGNSYLGSTGTLPATITAGSTESHTYTIAIPATWNVLKCQFVGMLIDASTGEILNAGKTSTFTGNLGVVENTNEFEVSVYPNPTSDLTNIAVNITEASDVTVEIYNAIGEIVFSNSSSNLSAGKYYYNVDVADFSAGMYVVKTTVNETVKTTKLSVK